jgi:hypothetical protein
VHWQDRGQRGHWQEAQEPRQCFNQWLQQDAGRRVLLTYQGPLGRSDDESIIDLTVVIPTVEMGDGEYLNRTTCQDDGPSSACARVVPALPEGHMYRYSVRTIKSKIHQNPKKRIFLGSVSADMQR